MVFVSGAADRPTEIWVSGLNGEAPRKLVSAEEGQDFKSLVWSPDSHWIAYFRQKTKGDGSADTSIEVQPVAGGPSKTLVSESSLPSSSTPECFVGCLSWSPDWNLVFTVAVPLRPNFGESKASLWQVHIDPDNGSPSEKPRRLAQLGRVRGLGSDDDSRRQNSRFLEGTNEPRCVRRRTRPRLWRLKNSPSVHVG